jgi:hypothetical protein
MFPKPVASAAADVSLGPLRVFTIATPTRDDPQQEVNAPQIASCAPAFTRQTSWTPPFRAQFQVVMTAPVARL